MNPKRMSLIVLKAPNRTSAMTTISVDHAVKFAGGSENLFPAGTQVKIYAGNESEATTEDPNVINKFVASLDEHANY